MKAYIGIDPGKTGAAALLTGKGNLDIIDYSAPGNVADSIGEWQSKHYVALACIEKVHAMPKQGVSSSFNFGTNYGIWQGIFAAFQIPVTLVTPEKWQKEMTGKNDGADTKERALNVARRLYPGTDFFKRKKDHNRADATLIANYIMNYVKV